jgi:GNAT superfamily N-acetyltransferase
MDCLFVRASYRNRGIGAALLRQVALEGKRLGVRHMQWQTPAWNVDADRFYRRMPLTVTEKLRYQMPLEKFSNEAR